MKIYDQHVHSFLSSDSHESFENYLSEAKKHGLTHFVTTEHLDLSCVYLGMDDIYDIQLQDYTIKKLQKKYNIKILKGVEMGYKFSRIKDIEYIVNNVDYDVVIMSVHEGEDAGCTSYDFLNGLTNNEAYSKYLDIYINMLQNISCFDIVGHIDFLLRYIDKLNIENHRDKLETLFKLIINKNKALEFNTRFVYIYKDTSYLEYFFKLYHDLGGKKVSLGSDAHSANYFLNGFDAGINILKNIGFSHLYTYQKRKETAIKI